MEDQKVDKSIQMYYIYGIIVITVILMIIRISIYFIELDDIATTLVFGGRDADLHLLFNSMDDGLVNFYESENPYLYFAYILFFPIYIIPFEISVYIWDFLRLISVIYIVKNIYKITDDKNDLYVFYFFSIIGYLVDGFLNNSNWLILFLLFESYIQLKKDRKILSGILFTLTTYKIILLIFPFALIISKKIKLKGLVYYFVPFFLICLPYLIFPNYFSEMLSNWRYESKDVYYQNILFISWRVFQTAQLLFISYIVLIFLDSLQWNKNKVRILLCILLVLIYFILIVSLISVKFVRDYI